MSRFDYVLYDDTAIEKHRLVSGLFEELEEAINNNLKDGRYKSLAFTAMQEAHGWLQRAIGDDQAQRSTVQDEQAPAPSAG